LSLAQAVVPKHRERGSRKSAKATPHAQELTGEPQGLFPVGATAREHQGHQLDIRDHAQTVPGAPPESRAAARKRRRHTS
jgi:hypothetical protein